MSPASEAASGRGVRVRFPVVLVGLLLLGVLLGRLIGSGPDPEALAAELADPAKRTIAYGKLLDLREAAVPALLDVAGRPGPARGEAIELLGRIGDPRALPVILAVDDPELADERLLALGKLRGDEALREVLAALRGADVPLKLLAIRTLSGWPGLDPSTVVAEVTPCLGHEVPGLREVAAQFVGAHRHEPAAPALIGLLRDDDASVRHKAAWALMQIGTPEAVAAVDSALRAGAVTPDGL